MINARKIPKKKEKNTTQHTEKKSKQLLPIFECLDQIYVMRYIVYSHQTN